MPEPSFLRQGVDASRLCFLRQGVTSSTSLSLSLSLSARCLSDPRTHRVEFVRFEVDGGRNGVKELTAGWEWRGWGVGMT